MLTYNFATWSMITYGDHRRDPGKPDLSRRRNTTCSTRPSAGRYLPVHGPRRRRDAEAEPLEVGRRCLLRLLLVEKGDLKEAIINYIALLGWNPGTEREKFTLEELVEAFDLGGISRSPAIFDVDKLTWLNGQFIRKMPLEKFDAIALPWIRKAVKRETSI